MQTTKQKALDWWNKLGKTRRDELSLDYHGNTLLLDEEIADIWLKEAPQEGVENFIKNNMWKQVEDYDYEINPEGIVRRISNRKIKKSHLRKSGYVAIQLCFNGSKKSFYLHRLLAEYFIPNIEGKKFVNHIDGNKHNNSISNLEWVTHSENMLHAFKNNLSTPHNKLKELQKEMSENKKKKVYYYDFNKNLIRIFDSVKEAESILDYKGNVSLYCRTNQITKKGIFSYTPLVHSVDYESII